MATGTLNITFDTPDVGLTGMGEFDISETFKDLFLNNTILKDEIGNKLSEIFKNIKAVDIAKNFTDKIKKSFDIDSETFNLTDSLNLKVQKFLEELNLNPNILSSDAKAEKIKKTSPDFIKQPVADVTKNYTEDTVFESNQNVVITDFTDNALNRLSTLFGSTDNTTKKKSKTKTDSLGREIEIEPFEPPKAGFLTGILGGLLGGMFVGKTMPAFITKLTGVSLLAGGMVWMAIDGIKGWMMAEDWGVSKISGALGAALGGLGSGAEGALKNAGKGAVIGAGIGTMIGGPIGLIVGALVGAAIGGILGWIGGETLAKNFDAIGVWFKKEALPMLEDMWSGIKEIFGVLKIASISIINDMIPILQDIWEDIKVLFIKLKGAFIKIYESLKPTINWITTELIPAIMEFIGEIIPVIKNIFLDIWNYLSDSLTPIFKSLWEAIKNIGSLLAPFTIWLWENSDWIIGGLWDIFKKLFSVIDFLIIKPILGIIHLIIGAVNLFFDFGRWLGEFIFKITEWFTTFKEKFIAFGMAIGEGASMILDWLTNLAKTTIESFKNGFKSLFDWIANLGTVLKESIISMLPERIRKWFKGETIEDSSTNSTATTTNTQDAIIESNNISIQPLDKDQFEPFSNGMIAAKPDGLLDKKLDTLIKIMNEVHVTLTNIGLSYEGMNNQSTYLAQISDKLNMLPALIPQPPPNVTQVPSIDVRDPIYEYRGRLYDHRIRGI